MNKKSETFTSVFLKKTRKTIQMLELGFGR